MNFSYYREKMGKTKGRYDVTPLFADKVILNNLIKEMLELCKNIKFDKIGALDSLGYVLGSFIAEKMKKGLVLIRKTGKINAIKGTTSKVYFTDYAKKKKGFELTKGLIKKGERILLIDEWMETGSQMKAAIKLIKKNGGEIAGIRTIAMEKNRKTAELFAKYDLNAIGIRDTTI